MKLGLFEGAGPRVRNAPPSAPLLDLLRDRMIAELARPDDPFALADAIVLLPTRRATRSLKASFATLGAATLLPEIRPLADLINEDLDVWGADPIGFDAPPAIEPLLRRLELASLLRKRDDVEGGADDPVQAIAIADELCKLLDAAATAENVDWTRLPDLVADRDLAAHWARSATFLRIIGEHWPERLAADGLMDPGARVTLLLNTLADQWTASPPTRPVIIAGSTGSVAAVRRLMGVVARLPRGVVVLPGLESDLDDAAWAGVDEQHPQHGLKDTLEALGIDRRDVPLLISAEETPHARARRMLLREALAPADVTADWRARLEDAARDWGDSASFAAAATTEFALIEAGSEDEEAMAAALALREALEVPGRTAALVTPDARLARRVAAKLKRWDIDAAISIGVPLTETEPGALLELLATLAADDSDPVALAALAEHPLCKLAGQNAARAFIDAFLRGPRCWPDLAAMLAAAKEAKPESTAASAVSAIEAIDLALAPLRALFVSDGAHLQAVAEALATAMAALSDNPWEGRAGEETSEFLGDLVDHGDALDPLSRTQARRVIGALLRGKSVPPDADDDPRIAIWGPLEARMQRRDVIVLGALNEGQWPAPPGDDAFLSRGMRRDLGLASIDARIGLAAHDFAQLANAPRVILTRALRKDGAPSVASRWLWRLEAIVRAAGGDLRRSEDARNLRAWAQALDKPAQIARVGAPAPKPAARGLRVEALSVTDVEKLVRDPYALYAKRILGLRVLDGVGLEPGPADRGNAVHAALEQFGALPAERATPLALRALLNTALRDRGFRPERRAAYLARVGATIDAFVRWQDDRRARGYAALLEKQAEMKIGKAVLTGRADRIDLLPGGGGEIIDYKTGTPPTAKAIRAGFSAQLLLEGALLAAGAFEGAKPTEPDAFIYWRFSASGAGPKPVNAGQTAPEAASEALANLTAGLASYDNPKRAFLSRTRMEHVSDVGDYDHLARWGEWADLGWDVE